MPRAKQPNPANNRTDLNTPGGPAHRMEAPDQAYGRVTAQEQSQRILPIGTPPQPTATPGAAVAPPAPQPTPSPLPGALPWADAPSNRPNEPITHGMPSGPGAGPEVLQGVGAAAYAQQSQGGSLRDLLSSMASKPGASSTVKQLLSNAS